MRNKVKIFKDLFSGEKVVDWEYVAGNIKEGYSYDFEDGIVTGADNDEFSKLIFSPIFKNGKYLLKVRLQDKYFRPKKGDSITFLFEGESFLFFKIDENPIEIMNHVHWGKIYETCIKISFDQLVKFGSLNFISWKFKSKNREILFKDGIAIESFRPMNNLQESIRSLFSDYINIISEENLVDSGEDLNGFSEDSCFVYVMRDLSNNSFKIGISNNPNYREKTLQSEKPTIEMVHKKEYKKRSIALVVEKVLHEYFENNRIRGEWFELSKENVSDLISILS